MHGYCYQLSCNINGNCKKIEGKKIEQNKKIALINEWAKLQFVTYYSHMCRPCAMHQRALLLFPTDEQKSTH